MSPGNPGVRKQIFEAPFRIKRADLRFTFRSGDLETVVAVASRLQGGNQRGDERIPCRSFGASRW